MLTGSKESIIQTSAHFLKLGDRNHALIPKLVELWCSKLKETTEKKKLSFIYLANEIINKSKAQDAKRGDKESPVIIQQDMKSFWQFYEDIISDQLIYAL